MRTGSRTRRFLAPLLLLGLGFTSCSLPSVRAYGGYTEMSLDGNIGIESDQNGLTTQNSVTELGLGDDVGSGWARVELGLGLPRITAEVFQFDESGRGRLSGDFGGIVGNTVVDTSLEFTSFKAALTFDLFDGISGGVFRLSPGVAVNLFDTNLSVEAALASVREEVDELVPIPMAYVQAELDLGVVAATGDIGFLTMDYDSDGTRVDGDYLDAEVLLRISPWDNVEFFGGYRIMDFSIEGSDDGEDFDVDLDLSGWIVGGGITF